MRRAVFLDRDGVLNRAVATGGAGSVPPPTAADVQILDGASAGCSLLRHAGYLLIVATNQPDVARGTQRREIVERINHLVGAAVGVDEILVCYHDDPDGCACRKPKPGLLLEAARTWDIDLSSSFMIGDRWRDIDAGRRAGCVTVLVGNTEDTRSVEPDLQFRGLLEAARWIAEKNDTGVNSG